MLIGAAVALVLLLVGLATSDVLALVGGILALTLGAIGTTFVIVQAKVFGDPEEHDRILREGRADTATISAVRNTSSRVGGNPLMNMDLEVGGRRVAVAELVPIQHVHLLQVGGPLPVRVDPGGAVVVDWAEAR
jgi:hypothetical protein